MLSSSSKSKVATSHKYDVEVKALPHDKKISVFGDDQYVPNDGEVVALHLKTKFSWSGDTMNIKDTKGDTWFSVKGHSLSLSNLKLVYGRDDKPLFAIADKVWWNPLNDDQLVFDCRGIDDPKDVHKIKKDKTKVLFKVKSNIGNTKQKTTVRNKAHKGCMDEMVDIVGKATIFQGKCAIWRDGDYKSGGIPIANFMSPLELQRFIGYKSLEDSTQDFYLTVAPGADVAFCIAFVLAVREMEKSYDM